MHSEDEITTKRSGPKLSGTLLVTDDAAFESMLGTPIPAPEASRPYHMNSSIQEIRESLIGAQIAKRVVAAFTANMGGKSNDETLQKMFEEMANNMPLRSLALFSQGRTNFEDLKQMIALLNHRYIEWIKLKYFSN